MNAAPRTLELNEHRRSVGCNRALIWPGGQRGIDRAAAKRAARELLAALGADLNNDGLRDTPRRMADTYSELLTPAPFNLTTFHNDEGYDELVVVRDILFQSSCMHHAGWLAEQLQPKVVGVVLEAEHLCMSLRGVQKPGAKTGDLGAARVGAR